MRALLLLLFTLPALAEFRGTVIYGEDNRVDASETSDAFLHSLAEFSVAFVPAGSIHDLEPGYMEIRGPVYGESKRLCREERFYHQETPAFCSGVLVGDDLVLTAGHCLDNKKHCHDTRLVFGFQAGANEATAAIPAENIFQCAEIVKKDRIDFALIRLDRPAGRRPAIAASSLPARGGLTAVGYPMGLPLKFALGGKVRRSSKNLLETNLDTFAGNSGSPVFNRAGELEGIVINGEDDLEEDDRRGCFITKRCPDDRCAGEDVLKISAILSRLAN